MKILSFIAYISSWNSAAGKVFVLPVNIDYEDKARVAKAIEYQRIIVDMINVKNIQTAQVDWNVSEVMGISKVGAFFGFLKRTNIRNITICFNQPNSIVNLKNILKVKKKIDAEAQATQLTIEQRALMIGIKPSQFKGLNIKFDNVNFFNIFAETILKQLAVCEQGSVIKLPLQILFSKAAAALLPEEFVRQFILLLRNKKITQLEVKCNVNSVLSATDIKSWLNFLKKVKISKVVFDLRGCNNTRNLQVIKEVTHQWNALDEDHFWNIKIRISANTMRLFSIPPIRSAQLPATCSMRP